MLSGSSVQKDYARFKASLATQPVRVSLYKLLVATHSFVRFDKTFPHKTASAESGVHTRDSLYMLSFRPFLDVAKAQGLLPSHEHYFLAPSSFPLLPAPPLGVRDVPHLAPLPPGFESQKGDRYLEFVEHLVDILDQIVHCTGLFYGMEMGDSVTLTRLEDDTPDRDPGHSDRIEVTTEWICAHIVQCLSLALSPARLEAAGVSWPTDNLRTSSVPARLLELASLLMDRPSSIARGILECISKVLMARPSLVTAVYRADQAPRGTTLSHLVDTCVTQCRQGTEGEGEGETGQGISGQVLATLIGLLVQTASLSQSLGGDTYEGVGVFDLSSIDDAALIEVVSDRLRASREERERQGETEGVVAETECTATEDSHPTQASVSRVSVSMSVSEGGLVPTHPVPTVSLPSSAPVPLSQTPVCLSNALAMLLYQGLQSPTALGGRDLDTSSLVGIMQYAEGLDGRVVEGEREKREKSWVGTIASVLASIVPVSTFSLAFLSPSAPSAPLSLLPVGALYRDRLIPDLEAHPTLSHLYTTTCLQMSVDRLLLCPSDPIAHVLEVALAHSPNVDLRLLLPLLSQPAPAMCFVRVLLYSVGNAPDRTPFMSVIVQMAEFVKQALLLASTDRSEESTLDKAVWLPETTSVETETEAETERETETPSPPPVPFTFTTVVAGVLSVLSPLLSKEHTPQSADIDIRDVLDVVGEAFTLSLSDPENEILSENVGPLASLLAIASSHSRQCITALVMALSDTDPDTDTPVTPTSRLLITRSLAVALSHYKGPLNMTEREISILCAHFRPNDLDEVYEGEGETEGEGADEVEAQDVESPTAVEEEEEVENPETPGDETVTEAATAVDESEVVEEEEAVGTPGSVESGDEKKVVAVEPADTTTVPVVETETQRIPAPPSPAEGSPSTPPPPTPLTPTHPLHSDTLNGVVWLAIAALLKKVSPATYDYRQMIGATGLHVLVDILFANDTLTEEYTDFLLHRALCRDKEGSLRLCQPEALSLLLFVAGQRPDSMGPGVLGYIVHSLYNLLVSGCVPGSMTGSATHGYAVDPSAAGVMCACVCSHPPTLTALTGLLVSLADNPTLLSLVSKCVTQVVASFTDVSHFNVYIASLDTDAMGAVVGIINAQLKRTAPGGTAHVVPLLVGEDAALSHTVYNIQVPRLTTPRKSGGVDVVQLPLYVAMWVCALPPASYTEGASSLLLSLRGENYETSVWLRYSATKVAPQSLTPPLARPSSLVVCGYKSNGMTHAYEYALPIEHGQWSQISVSLSGQCVVSVDGSVPLLPLTPPALVGSPTSEGSEGMSPATAPPSGVAPVSVPQLAMDPEATLRILPHMRPGTTSPEAMPHASPTSTGDRQGTDTPLPLTPFCGMVGPVTTSTNVHLDPSMQATQQQVLQAIAKEAKRGRASRGSVTYPSGVSFQLQIGTVGLMSPDESVNATCRLMVPIVGGARPKKRGPPSPARVVSTHAVHPSPALRVMLQWAVSVGIAADVAHTPSLSTGGSRGKALASLPASVSTLLRGSTPLTNTLRTLSRTPGALPPLAAQLFLLSLPPLAHTETELASLLKGIDAMPPSPVVDIQRLSLSVPYAERVRELMKAVLLGVKDPLAADATLKVCVHCMTDGVGAQLKGPAKESPMWDALCALIARSGTLASALNCLVLLSPPPVSVIPFCRPTVPTGPVSDDPRTDSDSDPAPSRGILSGVLRLLTTVIPIVCDAVKTEYEKSFGAAALAKFQRSPSLVQAVLDVIRTSNYIPFLGSVLVSSPSVYDRQFLVASVSAEYRDRPDVTVIWRSVLFEAMAAGVRDQRIPLQYTLYFVEHLVDSRLFPRLARFISLATCSNASKGILQLLAALVQLPLRIQDPKQAEATKQQIWQGMSWISRSIRPEQPKPRPETIYRDLARLCLNPLALPDSVTVLPYLVPRPGLSASVVEPFVQMVTQGTNVVTPDGVPALAPLLSLLPHVTCTPGHNEVGLILSYLSHSPIPGLPKVGLQTGGGVDMGSVGAAIGRDKELMHLLADIVELRTVMPGELPPPGTPYPPLPPAPVQLSLLDTLMVDVTHPLTSPEKWAQQMRSCGCASDAVVSFVVRLLVHEVLASWEQGAAHATSPASLSPSAQSQPCLKALLGLRRSHPVFLFKILTSVLHWVVTAKETEPSLLKAGVSLCLVLLSVHTDILSVSMVSALTGAADVFEELVSGLSTLLQTEMETSLKTSLYCVRAEFLVLMLSAMTPIRAAKYISVNRLNILLTPEERSRFSDGGGVRVLVSILCACCDRYAEVLADISAPPTPVSSISPVQMTPSPGEALSRTVSLSGLSATVTAAPDPVSAVFEVLRYRLSDPMAEVATLVTDAETLSRMSPNDKTVSLPDGADPLPASAPVSKRLVAYLALDAQRGVRADTLARCHGAEGRHPEQGMWLPIQTPVGPQPAGLLTTPSEGVLPALTRDERDAMRLVEG
ncbi:hypothetical protein KIPB_001220 [Kipferlia bialata]|uniref:Uncharacterized protein n=1 Tax=Kipferlia bialata TaxID=797122 RepID=A0A9K3CPZ9_9EUKA|nr:hypothetical protein KIPB_001220 [Kipferlia bialata]|eukprot:g1220.t1